MNLNKDEHRRNLGIDLLRIISMFFIVVLHIYILGKGGILSAFEPDNKTGIIAVPLSSTEIVIKYSLAWLLEIIAYCGVNCFALISGFVGIYTEGIYTGHRDKQLRKYFNLWSQVLFYCMSITIVVFIVIPEKFEIKTMLMSLVPFSTEQYWYFTAYTGVFFCTSILNYIVNELVSAETRNINNKGKMAILLFVIIVILYNTTVKLFGYDPLKLHGGYSFLWLAILYTAGAIVRKTDCLKKIPIIKLAIIGILSVLIAWAWKLIFAVPMHHLHIGGVNEDFFISYISPTVVVCAFVMLGIFERVTINSSTIKKIVNFIAPAVFGVYLFHDHPLISSVSIYRKLTMVAKFSVGKMILFILGGAGGIFLLGIIIEKMRQWILNKMGIDKIIEKTTQWLQQQLAMIVDKK